MGLIPKPETVIGRGECWTVVLNRNQDLLGKVMLILNRECEDVRQLTEAEWLQLHREMELVTSTLDGLFEPDHYNYSFLMNVDRQVHLHVIPRYGEPRVWNELTFEDVRFGNAPGNGVRNLPRPLLSALATALREHLAS